MNDLFDLTGRGRGRHRGRRWARHRDLRGPRRSRRRHRAARRRRGDARRAVGAASRRRAGGRSPRGRRARRAIRRATPSQQIDETFGQVDILVNLAVYARSSGRPEELTLDDWEDGLPHQRHELLPLLPAGGRRMIAQRQRRRDHEHVLDRRHLRARPRVVPLQRRQGRHRDADQGARRSSGPATASA